MKIDPQSVLAIAHAAGVEIMRVYQSGAANVQFKNDRSPLTAADLASDAVIQAGLLALTPDIPIVSEESQQVSWSERQTWDRCWMVDPLDGTKEFIARSGEFTVNIALLERGVPILGIVTAPALGRGWWGGPLIGGSWYDGTSIVCPTRNPDHVPRIVASRHHAGPETEAWIARVGVHERVPMGSSLKMCRIADGAADVYARLGPTMAWDTAAAHAVLLGAGGHIVDPDGIELNYYREDLHNPWFLAYGQVHRAWPSLRPEK